MRIKERVAQFDELEPIDVAPRLTLLLFLISNWVVGDQWQYKAPLQLFAIVGLLVPTLHRSRTLWLLIAVTMGVKTIDHWSTQDNHVFLLTWWSLALALGLGKEQPQQLVATQARLLIGFSFAFAAVWKGMLSDDFINGTYFHFTFLTDPRFADAAAIFGGVTDAMSRANLGALAILESPMAQVESIQLQDTERLRVVTSIVTWWTVAIEAGLAVTFLAPRVGRHRNVLLLVFALSTYLVANVATFGWTLLSMAAAQSESKTTRLLYVGACLVVLAYEHVPLLKGLRFLVVG